MFYLFCYGMYAFLYVNIFICSLSKQISGFDSLVAFICILILWAFWLFVQLTHLVKPPHFFLQEMMPCFLYSIYINFSNCTIKYCVISFPLIMQKQLVLQKYVIFVNGEMYWTIHFKISRNIITKTIENVNVLIWNRILHAKCF